jgi:hypothetical protein
VSDRHRQPKSGRHSAPSTSGKAAAPAGGSTGGASGQPASGQGPATGQSPSSGQSPDAAHRSGSHAPSGASRHGRRETERKRPPQPATPTLIDQLRKPFLASFVVFAICAGVLVLWTQAATPAYACSGIDTVKPAASGELGQIQPDMGNQHVSVGDHVTYQLCPPASGHHINQTGYGPLQPKVYGPDDKSIPNGWVHNLEHGGLVLLYSCDKGACDTASITALQSFSGQFPTSAICRIPPGYVGPVIARFEQMPTKYAALLWDRALYLDTLDTQKIDQFFLRYGERLSADGTWVAPPEPQCAAPSASPAASASPAPSASGS